eukprot:1183235-Prorocentrum_minimum.AAC.2
MNFRGHRMSGYNGNTTLDGELPSDGITVLSLFDGISGAGAALHKAGVKVARVIVAEVETVTPRPSNTPVTPRHGNTPVTPHTLKALPSLLVGNSGSRILSCRLSPSPRRTVARRLHRTISAAQCLRCSNPTAAVAAGTGRDRGEVLAGALSAHHARHNGYVFSSPSLRTTENLRGPQGEPPGLRNPPPELHPGIFSLPSRDWSPRQVYSLYPHGTGPRGEPPGLRNPPPELHPGAPPPPVYVYTL